MIIKELIKLEDELPFSIFCLTIFPEQCTLGFHLFGSKAAPIIIKNKIKIEIENIMLTSKNFDKS